MRYAYVVGYPLRDNIRADSILSEVDRTHAMALHSPARENIYLKILSRAGEVRICCEELKLFESTTYVADSLKCAF